AITGKAAEFTCAVVSQVDDKCLGTKIVIPNVKLMMVPLENLKEAHYLCGVLNSIIMRTIAASYMVEVEIGTHILQHIQIPNYNSNDSLHIKISELSEKVHQLSKIIHRENKSHELRSIED
ncbi:MAG: hypothetical protein QXK69_11580, partial [Candidatus Caldarchaeum sp.]